MRVLHTADWHLGQRLAGCDRSEEHALFLEWLLGTIRERGVELLLVAGDVFDSAHPPQATMHLYYDFLRDLSALQGCAALFVGGNHDSPAHLNAPSGLLKRFQIHVVGCASAERDRDILKISSPSNMLDSVCVCAVPYLRDRDVLQVVVGEAAGQREERLREGVYQYYHDMRRRAETHRQMGTPLIATGHLTLQSAGEDPGDVHEAEVGTLASLEGGRFPRDFDYLALGHLHGPHAVTGSGSIRYAGSPFPMSFAECGQEKSVVLLDFGDGVLRHSETLPVPVFRALHRFGGTLADLQRWADLTLSQQRESLMPWLEVHLSEGGDAPVSEKVMDLLRDRPVQVLKVLCAARESATAIWKGPGKNLQEYRPAEVFAERCLAAGLDPEDEEGAACRETFAELLALHETRALELPD